VSRTVRWQVLLIMLGMALAGILLAYLALTYIVRDVPTVGGTYVEGIAGSPHYINPLLSSYNEADQDLCALVFSGLTHFDGQGQVEPELATSWDVTLSPDGVIYVFHLRTDVRWHDGAPFTADDVVFTVQLLQDADYPGPSDLNDLWRTVEVQKVDAYTVQFIQPETFASFLDYTTIGILPSHLLEGIRAAALPALDFNLNPVGTGPFQVQELEIVEGQISSALLQRNPDYYGAGPLLEHIRLRFYPTHQSVLRAYEAGEVEGISQVMLDDLPSAYAAEGLELYTAQMSRYSLIFLNLGRPEELPFFQERDVRQALLYGLDREGLVEQFLHGQGMVAHSPIVAHTWAYDEDIRQYPYDPAQAGALLDGVGWRLRPGRTVRLNNGQPITFTLLASTDPFQAALAEEIARQWREVGAGVAVETVSPLALRDALEQRDYQAALIEFAVPGDPDPYPLWHQSQITIGQNYAGLDHRQISEILETARIIVDQEQRGALYRDFQDLFTTEVPAILLYHPMYTYAVTDKVKGVQIGPLMSPSDRFLTVNRWHVAWRRIIISQSEAR
jgi:peptide/nickel transport system substrate-binding protein